MTATEQLLSLHPSVPIESYVGEKLPPPKRCSMKESNSCKKDSFGFETSSWCLADSDDEEREKSEEDLLLVDEAEYALPKLPGFPGRQGSAIWRKERKILARQRKVLRMICGVGSSNHHHHHHRRRDDDGGDCDDEEGLHLSEDSLLWGCYSRDPLHRSRYYDERARCDGSFMIDLVGCLRRRAGVFAVGEGRRRVGRVPCLEAEGENAFLERIRVGNSFFRRVFLFSPALEGVLIDCIPGLPDTRTLRLGGDAVCPLQFRKIRPILLRLATRTRHRIRELRLDEVELQAEDEVREFADCFAAAPISTGASAAGSVERNRWENLTTLALEKISVLGATAICLDPIFRALGGGNGAGIRGEAARGRDDHLPNLKTFRLVQDFRSHCHLSDDGVLVRFMNNRTAIKHVALIGFVEPRHCHLMARHLSTHPSIETLELDARDFFAGGVPYREDEPAICESMRSLVRLVISNTNLRAVDVGGPFYGSLGQLLKPHERRLFARSRMNRNGLERFRRGEVGCGSPSSSSSAVAAAPSWTRRECIDFMAGLNVPDCNVPGRPRRRLPRHERNGEEEFESLVALDALYLSLRMRPDLCIVSHGRRIGPRAICRDPPKAHGHVVASS